MNDDVESTIARLEDAARSGALAEVWADDPAALARLARQQGAGFGAVIEALAGVAPAPGPVALPDLIATAAVRTDGAVVLADARFEAWLGAEVIDPGVCARVAARGGSVIDAVSARDGATIALAYGDAAHAQHWTLPSEIKLALNSGDAAVAVVAACPTRAADVLARAAAAYGLTQSESRLVVALVQTSDLRAATAAIGVQTSTARRTLADAMRKAGVSRQSALIARIATTALGYWPTGASDPALLIDAFGLSERQARLALGVARGLSRHDAARAVGASDAVTKDELDRVFQSTGVSSAQQLSRLVTETMALGVLAQVSNGEIAPHNEDTEPLRLIPRPSGGMIGVSDYGPPRGKPVCVLHSSSTTRHVSRSFVQALQAAGYRPFAIDRPGFGVTDMVSDGEPFENGGADMRIVCDALGLARIDIVARGGVYSARAFARDNADRVNRVVALNPHTPLEAPSDRPGFLGALTEAIMLHPDRLAFVARIVTGSATPARVTRLLRQALKSSPPDLAAMENEEALADYQRAVRHFAAGRVEGFIAEQRAITQQVRRTPPDASDNWRCLFGAHDPLHSAAAAETYWRKLLPHARFQHFEDGGRFLFLTHAEAIIASLQR